MAKVKPVGPVMGKPKSVTATNLEKVFRKVAACMNRVSAGWGKLARYQANTERAKVYRQAVAECQQVREKMEEERAAFERELEEKYDLKTFQARRDSAETELEEEIAEVEKELLSLELKVLSGKDQEKVMDELMAFAAKLGLVKSEESKVEWTENTPDADRIEREYAEDKEKSGDWQNEDR